MHVYEKSAMKGSDKMKTLENNLLNSYAFSYSMWSEPSPQRSINITPGKFIYSISHLNLPLIPVTVYIGEKAFATDRAMIDTGSNQTIVFRSFIGDINQEPVRGRTLATAGGHISNVNAYKASIELPANIKASDIEVLYSDQESAIDVLIGVDILSNGVLIYDGPNRRFLFEVK